MAEEDEDEGVEEAVRLTAAVAVERWVDVEALRSEMGDALRESSLRCLNDVDEIDRVPDAAARERTDKRGGAAAAFTAEVADRSIVLW